MSRNNSADNKKYVHSLERLKRLGIIKNEQSSRNTTKNVTNNNQLNISLHTDPMARNDIVKKLTNPFIKKTIKISVPISNDSSTSNPAPTTSASAATKKATNGLTLQVRKFEMPTDGIPTTTLNKSTSNNQLHPTGPPILYPRCSKCGAMLDNFTEFQRRMAGFESSFLIDFVCIRCVKQRQSVALDKKKYENLAIEMVQNNPTENNGNQIEDTFFIENVDANMMKNDYSDDDEDEHIVTKEEINIDDNFEDFSNIEYLYDDDSSFGMNKTDMELSSIQQNDDSSFGMNKTDMELSSIQQNVMCASTPARPIGNYNNDFQQEQEKIVTLGSPKIIDLTNGLELSNEQSIAPPSLLSPIQFDENDIYEMLEYDSDEYLDEQFIDEETYKGELKPPLNDSNDIEPMQYYCLDCNRYYVSLQNLKVHGYAVHNPDRLNKKRNDYPYQCDICKKSYQSLSKLKGHIYYMHVDIPSLMVSRNDYKKMHSKFINRRIYDGNSSKCKLTLTFKCKICSQHFVNQTALDRHTLRRHPDLTNRDPMTIFNCDKCKFTYGSYKRLRAHIYYYHPSKYSKMKCSRKMHRVAPKHYSIVRQGTKITLLLIKPLFIQNTNDNLEVKGEYNASSGNKDDTFIVNSKDNETNRYKCQICWRSFKRAILLKTHLRYYDHEAKKGAFECKHCSTRYKTWKHLQCHYYYKHPNEKPKKPPIQFERGAIVCHHCNTSYKSWKDLKEHFAANHPNDKPRKPIIESDSSDEDDDDEKLYKCSYCNTKYRTYEHLVGHFYYNHPGIKPKEIQTTQSELLEDNDDSNEKDNPIKSENNGDDNSQLENTYYEDEEWISDPEIDEIKNKFSKNTTEKTISNIKTYAENVHQQPIESIDLVDVDDEQYFSDDDNLTKCSFCLRKYKSKELCDAHQHYCHKLLLKSNQSETVDRKNYHCEICNRYFARKTQFTYHNYYRHSNRNKIRYQCRLCTDEFRTTNMRAAHERITHQNAETLRYDCEICDESFPKAATLQGHINLHNGIKPYVCDQCGRGFAMEYYLNNHMGVHTNEKPFNCDKCKLKFRYESSLKKHAQSHVDFRKRIYNKCTECPKKYADIRDLKRHYLKQHDENAEKIKCTEIECCFEAYQMSDLKRHLRTMHNIFQKLN